MKKKLAKLLVAALILSVLGGLAPAQAAGGTVKRIGLIYGSNAAAAVQLTNVKGSGFRLGYVDEQGRFFSLAKTGEKDIQVLITQNLYLNSKGGFGYSSDGSRGAVGCYHVQLPTAYPDFDSALAAAQQVEGGFVAWIDGTYSVRMGAYTKKDDAVAAAAACAVAGAALGETSGYGYSVVAAGTTRVLFQFDANVAGETGALAVRPGLEDGADAVTQLNGGDQYRGDFRFERINGGASTVVNLVDLETYIKGIVPYEMTTSWPLEALKAQAVCARTYSMSSSRQHGSDHFDLCNTTHCQAYRGVERAGTNSDRAVDETAGQLIYYNGKPVTDAVYYSSNGGASEDAKNVWGSEVGYLKGKLDPYEADIASVAGNYSWSKTYTAAELKERFHAKNYACDDIVDLTTKLSATGNVIELKIVDAAGKSYTISKADSIRTLLGLNSIRFTVTTSGSAQGQANGGYEVAGAESPVPLDSLYALGGDGKSAPVPSQSYIITGDGVKALEPVRSAADVTGVSYTFTGTGWGHSVGMSQWGAYAMAKRGYTYLDILNFYYTGITVQ